MTTDNALILGVILIIIGVAFALLAYAALLFRRTEAPEAEQEAEGDSESDAVEEAPVEESPEPAADEPQEMEATSAEPESVTAEGEPPPDPSPPAEDSSGEAAEVPLQSVPVASLVREGRTGRLVVRVGEEEYESAGELRDSPHWDQVSSAISDLRSWLEEYDALAGSDSSNRLETETETAKGESQTMIQQIDSILTRKLSETGSSHRAVRLAEGADGAVKVYIGVQSYPLEEVPDEEIRRLIREAVEEWEESQ